MRRNYTVNQGPPKNSTGVEDASAARQGAYTIGQDSNRGKSSAWQNYSSMQRARKDPLFRVTERAFEQQAYEKMGFNYSDYAAAGLGLKAIDEAGKGPYKITVNMAPGTSWYDQYQGIRLKPSGLQFQLQTYHHQVNAAAGSAYVARCVVFQWKGSSDTIPTNPLKFLSESLGTPALPTVAPLSFDLRPQMHVLIDVMHSGSTHTTAATGNDSSGVGQIDFMYTRGSEMLPLYTTILSGTQAGNYVSFNNVYYIIFTQGNTDTEAQVSARMSYVSNYAG